MSASHLKRWTIASAIACDVRDRGIPWTQLIWRYRAWNDDLNLRRTYRWSILLAYLFVGALLLTRYDGRSLVALGPIAATTTIINWRSYRFFYARRGLGFAARVWLLRVIQDLFNGVSFAAGTCLFFCARYLGIRMPGALPADCWTVAGRGGQFQQDRARRISVI
jgi:hypothetical protein